MAQQLNYEIQPCIDGEWGEIHEYVFQDAVTQAKWELKEFGAMRAMRNLQALQELVDSKTWRSVEAADLILRIQRLALEEKHEVRIGKVVHS